MRNFIGHTEARSTDEFLELALGTPLDLWLGEDGESEAERAARMDAARDIIADDPTLLDRTASLVVDVISATRPDLLRLAPPVASLRPAGRGGRRMGAAA